MIEQVQHYTLPAAFALLPQAMQTEEATALLLAIGLQESRFVHRRQVGGPARGFWQFELGGVKGVLEHEATMHIIADVSASLRYGGNTPLELHLALEHNDVLAAAFARCLLYTLPNRLPGEHDAAAGWACYVAGWRPGKPLRDTWDNFYQRAWALTSGRQPA